MFRGGDSAADLGAQGAAADAVGKDHHAVAIGKPGLEPGAVGIVRAAVAEPPRRAVTVEKRPQSDTARPDLRHHVTGERRDRKSTRLNSSHLCESRMPSSA